MSLAQKNAATLSSTSLFIFKRPMCIEVTCLPAGAGPSGGTAAAALLPLLPPLHSGKLFPDHLVRESMVLASALVALSANEVVSEFDGSGCHNAPRHTICRYSIAWCPLDKLLSLEGLLLPLFAHMATSHCK